MCCSRMHLNQVGEIYTLIPSHIFNVTGFRSKGPYCVNISNLLKAQFSSSKMS